MSKNNFTEEDYYIKKIKEKKREREEKKFKEALTKFDYDKLMGGINKAKIRKRSVGVMFFGCILFLIGIYHIFYAACFIFLTLNLNTWPVYTVRNVYRIINASYLGLFNENPLTGTVVVVILAICYLIVGINILQLKDRARRFIVKWSVIFAIILFAIIARGVSGLLRGTGSICIGPCPPGHDQIVIIQFIAYSAFFCLFSLIAYFFTRPKVKEQFK